MSAYLEAALRPLAPDLTDPTVVEIMCQEEGAYWVERQGRPGLERVERPELSDTLMQRLARLVAGASAQEVGPTRPLLSAALPPWSGGGGERIQFVLPPAAPRGPAFAIRRQVRLGRRLAEYEAEGALEGVHMAPTGGADANEALARLARKGAPMEFLRAAIAARETILISGGTSSGKTTLLNALLAEIPLGERILTIEDAPELHPPQPCRLSLIASRGEQGGSGLGMEQLLEAALRLRPDRILMGELRGREAGAFLRAINTGHQGSLTTVHADSPDAAFEQVALMVLQSGMNLTRNDVLAYVRSIVRVVVQTARIGAERRITAIRYLGAGA